MKIWCCACNQKVEPRLAGGQEIYPHRKDLETLAFWKCDACQNYVGCHSKSDEPLKPLGNIPTPELRDARKHIHKILDPLWKDGLVARKHVYNHISKKLGYEYHTAQIKTIEEAREVYVIIREFGRAQKNR